MRWSQCYLWSDSVVQSIFISKIYKYRNIKQAQRLYTSRPRTCTMKTDHDTVQGQTKDIQKQQNIITANEQEQRQKLQLEVRLVICDKWVWNWLILGLVRANLSCRHQTPCPKATLAPRTWLSHFVHIYLAQLYMPCRRYYTNNDVTFPSLPWSPICLFPERFQIGCV